jgi:ankyrin repeat protein
MRYYFQKDATTGKSRYDPNGRCLDGGTPLHAAIKAKQKETIQLLIQNGADLSLVDFVSFINSISGQMHFTGI